MCIAQVVLDPGVVPQGPVTQGKPVRFAIMTSDLQKEVIVGSLGVAPSE